ncbi:MAG: phosphonoacetaldehyde reductase [Planctomycetaceae bacterium]|nr:phosphonoacetaldehyde reductase [Planctomycetaceae bacterium]
MKDYVGFGAVNEALLDLAGGDYHRVLVVASESGWERFNAVERRRFFTERETVVFSGFSINPEFDEILAGVEVRNRFRPDLIVAYGGGSPIDVAKMIKVVAFTKEPYDPDKPETLVPSGDGPPVVAIATTAGSGAEATMFAVFYRHAAKVSLASRYMRPEMAVADPEMTYSLPPYQTAATGFDGLSQSVEAYWASSTSEKAREIARTSIGYILPNIYNAVHSPEPGNRYHMLQGSYLSGEAINLTRTTMPHALGYHLTKKYNLPHGHAVALTLPYFFILNMDESLETNSPLGPEGQRENMRSLFSILGQKTAEDAFQFWRNLMQACGLAVTFSEVGVDSREKMEALVDSMNLARMNNHPVKIGRERLVDFFLSR